VLGSGDPPSTPPPQPIPDQANVSTPQILQPETNGNAR